MASAQQFGVVSLGGEYSVHNLMGTKDDGATVIFPPLNVAAKDVLGYFDTVAEGQVWILTREKEDLKKQLAAEKAAHQLTKSRAQVFLDMINGLRDAL